MTHAHARKRHSASTCVTWWWRDELAFVRISLSPYRRRYMQFFFSRADSYSFIQFIGTQLVAFIIGVAGSAVLLDYSTLNSSIQPILRNSFRRLIMSSGWPQSAAALKMIQENVSDMQWTKSFQYCMWAAIKKSINDIVDTQIGCCGADGSHDYILLRQPLPDTCRDSVTGNAYFNGCVEELTWLLEDKVSWVAALAMTLAFIQVHFIRTTFMLAEYLWIEHWRFFNYWTKFFFVSMQVVNAVLSLILVQALKKEEEDVQNYRHWM